MLKEHNIKYCFQNCQKIVVFSQDGKNVLLAKRKDEADYNGTYSFIGGKMEEKDETIVAGMQREKNEEVGNDFKIKLYPVFTTVVYFHKKDGSNMVLPHYYAKHISGDVRLNEEYSEYKWVSLDEIKNFEPKIATIPKVVEDLLRLKPLMREEDFVIL